MNAFIEVVLMSCIKNKMVTILRILTVLIVFEVTVQKSIER